jgi:hypothetical protein
LHDIARFCTILHEPYMRHSNATSARPLLVLISGPYSSGTGGDPSKVAANRARLEGFALPIYERGHLPIIAEWLALPIIHAAGGRIPGDAIFDEYQYPVAHRLIERCDAVLRIPGDSRGADMDVARARGLGLRIFHDPRELP